jgi:hypothetical protein
MAKGETTARATGMKSVTGLYGTLRRNAGDCAWLAAVQYSSA